MNTWSDYLTNKTVVEYPMSVPEDRQIRNAISRLRKKGTIFISVKSVGKGFRKYIRFENATDEQKNIYINKRMKAWKTTYFNTIVPIQAELKDDRLFALMGALGE